MNEVPGSFSDNLRKAREDAGMTHADVARAVRVSREAVSQWESGETAPLARRIPQIAAALGVDVATLLTGADGRAPTPASKPPTGDVPVLALKRNGPAGAFTIGDVVAGAPRLPRITSSRDVFAVYAPTDVLAPWRQVGELVYFDPHRPAKRGDRVLVELAGEGRPAAIGELEEPSKSGAIRIRTYNPSMVHQFDAAKVLRVIRAIEWPELVSAA